MCVCFFCLRDHRKYRIPPKNNNNTSQAGVLSDLNSKSGTKHPFINIKSMLSSSWTVLWLWSSFLQASVYSSNTPLPHNTHKVRLLIKPATNTTAKTNHSSFLHIFPLSPRLHASVRPVYPELKPEDVERCLFAHHNISDPISPASTQT